MIPRSAQLGAAGVALLVGVLTVAEIGRGDASLTGQTGTPAIYASAAMAAPSATTCRWTSATQLTFSWSLTPGGAESSTDVWRSDTPTGVQTLAANVPVATTSAVVSPTPVTTVRWLTANTKRSSGSWVSAQPPRIASNTCQGSINAAAGSGTAGFAGDGSSATAARLSAPRGIAVDAGGNLFVADTTNNRIRRVDAVTGTISTVIGAGGGSPYSACSFAGTAAAVKLRAPEDVAVDASGNLYVADTGQACIRRIDTSGNVTRVAGGGATTTCSATGAAATVRLLNPRGIALDPSGAVVVADSGRNCVRRVAGGTFSVVAGGGATSACTASGSATGVSLSNPTDVATTAAGDVLIADTGRNCVRKVVAGAISQVVGGGATTSCGATTAATAVKLTAPEGVAVDGSGRVIVNDTGRRCTRLVGGGTASPLSFTGTSSSTGNQGPALAATARTPSRVAVGPSGDVYVSDRATNAGSNVVRRITGPHPA